MDASQTAVDCKFCSAKGAGWYTCPRCNARYCSVECYKSMQHLSCSELFYRDCFMEGLRTMQSDSSERSKLMEMLQRLEMDCELDDFEGIDLAERFADVSLEDCSSEFIWQRLTDVERAEFEKLASTGQLSSLVNLWEPWWYAKPGSLVEEIGQESRSSTTIPPVLSRVQGIDQLAKSGTSNLILFSIINVLYGYAYTARLYNGEHLTMASESARVMLDISESLGRGVFSDVSLAIGGCLTQLSGSEACSHFISREYSVSVVGDVCKIVAGVREIDASFPLAVLSDCHRVFHSARKETSRRRRQSGHSNTSDDRQRYLAVEKKLEYFISWLFKHEHSLLDLLPAVELVSCELSTELAVYLSEKAQVEDIISQKKSETKERPLIEEITC